MGRTIEQQLSDLYLANLDAIGEGLPEAVNAARRGFLETLTLSGLPSVKDEKYRHTDLRAMFTGDWEVRFDPDGGECEPLLTLDGYRIPVVNGFCTEGVVTLDNGIIYGSLRDAMAAYPEIVLKHYNTLADNDSETVVALSSLFMQDGAFVYIPEGVSSDRPFLLDLDRKSVV